jgi:hypothetical protein
MNRSGDRRLLVSAARGDFNQAVTNPAARCFFRHRRQAEQAANSGAHLHP